MRISTPPHIIVDASRRFSVYSDEFIAVPSRQIGIAASAGNENLLKALSLYLSSDFVIYQQFLTTSEWGISTSRSTLASLKNLPIPLGNLSNQDIISWAELRDNLINTSQNILRSHFVANTVRGADGVSPDIILDLNERVAHLLGLRESEKILIRDFVNVTMTCVKGKVTREGHEIPSESSMRLYLHRLKRELDAFIADDPIAQHEIIVHYDTRSAMIAIRLTQDASPQFITIRAADQETTQEFVNIREHLRQRHSQWMYFNRNLRIYDNSQDTIYCFKPMQALHWTERQAILDAGEVISEALVTEEIS